MRGSKMSKMLWNEKKLILLAHGLSAEGAKADVKIKKNTRLTILPFCVIKSYSLFFSFWLFISFQYSNPSSYSCGPSLSYVLRCYTSISDGFFPSSSPCKPIINKEPHFGYLSTATHILYIVGMRRAPGFIGRWPRRRQRHTERQIQRQRRGQIFQ